MHIFGGAHVYTFWALGACNIPVSTSQSEIREVDKNMTRGVEQGFEVQNTTI